MARRKTAAKPPVGPDLRIEYARLPDLVGHPQNPKAHNVFLIVRSIREYGFTQPILLDERTGRIVAGHGRQEALRAMRKGGEPVPLHVRVDADGEWLVPVVRGNEFTTDEAAERYLIVDNRLVEAGGWDEAALVRILQDQEPIDLEAMGYTDQEVDRLLRAAQPEEATQPAPVIQRPHEAVPDPRLEAADELLAKWGVRTGDLWHAGRHRIGCGDCRDEALVRRVTGIPAGQVSIPLVLSDPPYCSGGFQEASRTAGTWGKIVSDNLSTRGYRALIQNMLEVVRPQTAYLFTDWRMWIPLFDLVEGAGIPVRAMIVWDKINPGLGAMWRTQHELVMFASASGKKKAKKTVAKGNVLRSARSGNHHHYTEKPVPLLQELLEGDAASDRGRCPVYDPFLGSGSTALAAELDGRPCHGIEIEPKIVAVALERLAEAGLNPTRDPG